MSDDNYIVDPVTGEKFPIGGCLISDKPSNEPKYGASRMISTQNLRSSVDLRPWMTPVEHQLQSNACVANALAGAYEYLINRKTGRHIDVSRLFIYYNARRNDNPHTPYVQDQGTRISSAMRALAQHGCCKENIFPYREEYINQIPSQQCYDEGKRYRIASSMSLNANLDEMKACLTEEYPFAFGLHIFQRFALAGSNGGCVPMPHQFEHHTERPKGHAMLAVGYDDSRQWFIVRNSYGSHWGHKGYCYIPYDYMANPHLCRDLHAIKSVTSEPRQAPKHHVENAYYPNTNNYVNQSYPNTNNYVNQNYSYDVANNQGYWNNNYNYINAYNNVYQHGQVVPVVWYYNSSKEALDKDKLDSNRKFILWIDKNQEENAAIGDKLSKVHSVQIGFCETMEKAEDYLTANDEFLQSLPSFQIICRGFYRDENKNPLNLLEFLTKKGISNAQVFVFTGNEKNLSDRLDERAADFKLQDWRQKLSIHTAADPLIDSIAQGFNKKN